VRRARGLLALLPAVALATALSAAPAQAEGPVGGARLTDPAVVVDGGPETAPPPVSAASYVVADATSGAVLAAKDAHGGFAPASTLKTLTAVALLPVLDKGARVVPTFDDVNVDGSRVGLVQQLDYPVDELFSALLIVSANDSAGALATAAGGMPTAVGLLNAEAGRLQARDTHALNTSGLDADGQTSSAYDLALIARAGLQREDFRGYVGRQTSSIAAPDGRRIEIYNHNRLLRSYPGAIGVKNGYTDAARASFVGAATRDGHTLVVTLMRADPSVWKEAAALLDWGFAATARGAAPVGRLVDPLPPPSAPVDATSRSRSAQGAAASPQAASPASASPASDDGSGPALPVAGGVLAVGSLLVLRRRQVQQRARRRARRP